MKINLFEMTKKVLYQEYGIPTDDETEKWKASGGDEKLHYVIRGEDGQIIDFIDSKKVDEVNATQENPMQPKKVAEYLFDQIGIATEEKYEAVTTPIEVAATQTKAQEDIEESAEEPQQAEATEPEKTQEEPTEDPESDQTSSC